VQRLDGAVLARAERLDPLLVSCRGHCRDHISYATATADFLRKNCAPADADTGMTTTHAHTLPRTGAGQAYLLLRVVFVIAPIAAGIDKFADVLVDWDQYLAPWINDILPGSAQDAMHVIGVVEIAAGLLVLVNPRYGAPLVAAWLGGIVFNLLTYSGYYDIALRDFGLMVGALALWRLSLDQGASMPRREQADDARRADQPVRVAAAR
jgi:hypothetical protein